MSEIKIIDTGKVQLLTYLLPKEATDVRFRFNRFLTFRRPHSSHVEMFDDKMELLGIDTELTEEQCSGVVDEIEVARLKKDIKAYRCYNSNGPFSITAKKSLQSLLEANKCYSVNPYGEDPCQHNTACYDSCQGSCWTRADIDYDEWHEAEANTGTWLILWSKP